MARSFDILTPLTSKRQWNKTLIWWTVPQRLYWDFSIECGRGRSCVSLFCRYYNRFSSSEISGPILDNQIFLRNTRLSHWEHPSVVDWPVDRTIPYTLNTFFKWTIHMWNSFRGEVALFLALKEWRIITTGVRK